MAIAEICYGAAGNCEWGAAEDAHEERKVNCAPMLGERPAATVKITVPMYTVATECLGEGPCEERSQPITDQELR